MGFSTDGLGRARSAMGTRPNQSMKTNSSSYHHAAVVLPNLLSICILQLSRAARLRPSSDDDASRNTRLAMASVGSAVVESGSVCK